MKKAFLNWFTTYLGTYYIIEIEEKATQFPQTGLRKYRVIVRAMTTLAAISAARNHCAAMKEKDHREYELAFIQRI